MSPAACDTQNERLFRKAGEEFAGLVNSCSFLAFRRRHRDAPAHAAVSLVASLVNANFSATVMSRPGAHAPTGLTPEEEEIEFSFAYGASLLTMAAFSIPNENITQQAFLSRVSTSIWENVAPDAALARMRVSATTFPAAFKCGVDAMWRHLDAD